MSHLVILIPPRHSRPSWLWTGPQAQVVEYVLLSSPATAGVPGQACFADLPQALHTTVVLAASDALQLSRSLPSLPLGRLYQALPALLEEQLLDETEQQVFGLDPLEHGQSPRIVTVVAKTWLQQLQHALDEAGLKRVAFTSAQQLLPTTESASDSWLARGWPTPDTEQPPLLEIWGRIGSTRPSLLLAADQAAGWAWLNAIQSNPPAPLHWLPSTSASAPSSDALPTAWREPQSMSASALAQHAVRRPLRFDPHTASSGWLNQFAARMDWVRLKPSGYWLAAALACSVFGNSLEVWRMQREADHDRAAMVSLLQQAQPQLKVILDPALQLHQAYLAAMAPAAVPSQAFLDLASATAKALDLPTRQAIESLDYGPTGLHLQFAAGTDPAAISRQWQQAGLTAHADAHGLGWQLEPQHAP